MVSRILVGGGTGFIGKNLVQLLRSNNYEVVIISRQEIKDAVGWDYIKYNGIPENVDSVINVSGHNVFDVRLWNKKFRDQVYNSRVETTKALAKAIDNADVKPKSFITISGVGIYPPSTTAQFDESVKVEGYDFLSNMCHDWEAASKLEKSPDCRLVNIRSGVVLGNGGGMIEDLYLPFSWSLGGHIGTGKQFMPWIHMDDLTNLFLYCVENNVSGTLNGVAPETITNKQFTDAFAKSLNATAKFKMSEFLFNVLLSKERANMITKGQCVIPKRTLETGFEYKYPDIQSACDTFIKIKKEK